MRGLCWVRCLAQGTVAGEEGTLLEAGSVRQRQEAGSVRQLLRKKGQCRIFVAVWRLNRRRGVWGGIDIE